MVRHVGRSRGCKSCLQRRIKCDEKVPECTQCVSRGQNCPGPTVGAVFVTMKPRAKKAGIKEIKESNTQKAPTMAPEEEQNDDVVRSSAIINSVSPSGNDDWLYSQFLLPSSYQPSKMASFQQLFVGHFISSFDNGKLHRTPMKSWFTEIPTILVAPSYGNCHAPFHAVMMVHYGVMTLNESIQMEAYRWYAKALEGQRKFLQKDRLGLSRTMPNEGDILSSVVLSLFELVSSTTPMGWIDHQLGAASMMQMRKPENCRDGLVHLIFRSMRFSVVYLSMTMEEPHVFATHPWTTVPFEVHPKTVYDRIVDILLLIPGCLLLYKQINQVSGLDIMQEHKLRLELELTATSLMQRIRDWWEELVEFTARQTGKDTILLYGLGGPKNPSRSNEPYFLDAFTACITASYHTGNIILYALLSFASSQTHIYDSEIESHASQILLSVEYLIKSSSCTAGTLMMVFPLKIMCHCCQNEFQKQYAFEILEMWGQKKGIDGICTQAAPLYDIPKISVMGTEVCLTDSLHDK